jgi:DNA-binding transcriptional LysR family regulator
MTNMQGSHADLNEIRAFVALADTGSFVGAGRQLRTDPAMISRRLQSLESRLGVRLAERTTRVVMLSEAGRAYLVRVRPLLDDLERADQEAAAFAGDDPSGHLRISVPGDVGRIWLAPIVTTFLAAHPRVTIEVDATSRFVDLVGERYDLAIRLGVLPDSRLVARKVADRRRLLCASPDYLARHGMPMAPTDLSDHACLCFTGREDPYLWSFAKPGKGVVAVTISGPLAATDAEMLVDTAVAGLGILHTTDWYVGRELAAGRLIEVLPAWPLLDRGAVYVVTPAAAGAPSKTKAFSDWVADNLRRPPWQVVADELV